MLALVLVLALEGRRVGQGFARRQIAVVPPELLGDAMDGGQIPPTRHVGKRSAPQLFHRPRVPEQALVPLVPELPNVAPCAGHLFPFKRTGA